MPNPQQVVIIVSGMSGGGKSTALNALEDLGYYCVDNLPGELLSGFGPQLSANPDLYKKVALGIDARSRETNLQVVLDCMNSLRKDGFECKLLFLTADKPVLIQRFSETKRRHPLTGSDLALPAAIESEQQLLEPLRLKADLVIDSSNTNIHQLRRQVWNFADRRSNGLSIVLQSFAFKQGVPQDVDFMFDARILPNPFWQEELKALNGKDVRVQEWLEGDERVVRMTADIQKFMSTWLPAFQEAQRSYVTIGIGCTGGKHRSVYLAETLGRTLLESHDNVLIHHREMASWNNSDQPAEAIQTTDDKDFL